MSSRSPSALAALAIVPARIGSTRLPRKVLLRSTGRYLFEHVVRNAQRCRALSRVLLATDSEEVLAAARAVGVEALLTSAAHPSGTDRVREAYARLRERGEGPFDVVLGLQGDEPELDPDDLARLVEAFADPGVELATLAAPLGDEAQAALSSVVKVVRSVAGDALYFSRAPIPWTAHPEAPPAGLCWRHVGVYAFRPEALERFAALPRGALERTEGLEQLRWLEAGRRIRVLPAAHAPVGIDTPEDYARFVERQAHSVEAR